MQCITCHEEVSAKFLSAFSKNACPFCGDSIMAPELHIALNSLREVMTDLVMKNFTKEAESWLRSNFDLVAIDSDEYQALTTALVDAGSQLTVAQTDLAAANKEIDSLKSRSLAPIPRSGKGLAPPGVQMGKDKQGNPIQLQGDQIQDPSTTNSFLQRSGASRMVSKTADLKAAVAKLKSNGGQSEGDAILAAAWNAPEGIDEVHEDGEFDPYAGNLPADPYDGIDHLDPIAEQFVAMGDNGQSSTYNAKDVQGLKAQHSKVARAARDLASGGAAGIISRA